MTHGGEVTMHATARTYLDTAQFQCPHCQDWLHASDFPEPGEFPLAEKYQANLCNGCSDEIDICEGCATVLPREEMNRDEQGQFRCEDCHTPEMLAESHGCYLAHLEMET